jgi:BASS family bile acid:Na+ symporter
MNVPPHPFAGVTRFLDRNFLWLLLSSYLVAALLPEPGLWVRQMSLGEHTLFGENVHFTVPMLLLALLLWNAGLEVPVGEVRHLVQKPGTLFAGLVANWLVPVGYILLTARLLRLWHQPADADSILVGLALIASMPIAGSSTAWSRKANSNLALSLGLVLLSTCLSPLATPLVLYAVSLMGMGETATDLQELALHGTGIFLFLCVLVPSLLGMLTLRVLGRERVASAKPYLKLFNSVVLLLLIYTNAAESLPKALYENHEPAFLALLTGIAVTFCVAAFFAGWLVARLMRADPGETRALLFGLGMNNNGTGMVLASQARLPWQVQVLIVCYNLVQHLVAGGVDFALARRPARPSPDAEPGADRLPWSLALRPFLSFSFMLVAGLVLANAGASYWNIHLLAANHRRVARTHEVQVALRETLSLLREAETAQRDYLLTGYPQSLTPYDAAFKRIQQRLRLIQRKTRDNPEQHDRVGLLEERVAERKRELDAVIVVRKDQGFEAARQAVLKDREREGLISLRQVLDDMEEHEEMRLEQRTRESDARVSRALATVVLLSCVVLVYTFLRRLGSVQKRARRGPLPPAPGDVLAERAHVPVTRIDATPLRGS